MITNVLFVCMGNICRSPLAEAMFQQLVDKAGLSAKYVIDSAGTTSYHVGERADPRMRRTARGHGLEIRSRARQVQRHDFDEYDLIVAMDRDNHANLLRLARDPEQRNKVRLLREFDPQADGNLEVPDPYYGGDAGFENVYQIVARSSRRLLDELERE